MRGRAIRRFHKERMKRKAAWVGRVMWDWQDIPAGKYADNLAICSCEMCGNPRRHFKELTVQERKQLCKEVS